jgi:hypothetical protein
MKSAVCRNLKKLTCGSLKLSVTSTPSPTIQPMTGTTQAGVPCVSRCDRITGPASRHPRARVTVPAAREADKWTRFCQAQTLPGNNGGGRVKDPANAPALADHAPARLALSTNRRPERIALTKTPFIP